jgi:hypothetical protein
LDTWNYGNAALHCTCLMHPFYPTNPENSVHATLNKRPNIPVVPCAIWQMMSRVWSAGVTGVLDSQAHQHLYSDKDSLCICGQECRCQPRAIEFSWKYKHNPDRKVITN